MHRNLIKFHKDKCKDLYLGWTNFPVSAHVGDWMAGELLCWEDWGFWGQQAKYKWQQHSLGDEQCSGLWQEHRPGKQRDRWLSLAVPSSDQIWNTAPSVGLSCMKKWLISSRKPNQQGDLCLQHMTCDENLQQSGFSSLKEESCMWVWQTNTDLPTLKSKSPNIAAWFFDEVDMARMKQWHKTKMGGFNWIEEKTILLRTIKHWSWLPRVYRNSPSLEVFKTQLEKAPRSLIRIQLSMTLSWSISQRPFPMWMIGFNSNQSRSYKIKRAMILTVPQKNAANFGV